MINWISEENSLPMSGQTIIHASPRMRDEFWNIRIRTLLIRFEGVIPLPVPKGSKNWPTEYYWGDPYNGKNTSLITGNGYWANLTDLTLPPNTEIFNGSCGDKYIVGKNRECLFVPQNTK